MPKYLAQNLDYLMPKEHISLEVTTRMEALIAYLVVVVVVVVPFSLLFLIPRRNGSGHPKNLPRGSGGWPILGKNVELARSGIQRFVRDRMDNFSPVVFKTSLVGENVAVLCGAQGNKFVYTNQNKCFKRWHPLSLQRVLFQDVDRSRHDESKASFNNFQYDLLKPEALKQYMSVMDTSARDHLGLAWRPGSVVKALPSLKRYALELMFKVFMDVADTERVCRLLEPLEHLTGGIMCMPVNLPWMAFGRAMKGSKIIRAEVVRMVRERRKELMTTATENRDRSDLLSKMVTATNEDGQYMSDNMVVNVILGLLTAGQHEVSTALTIVVYFLAQLPHIYDLVFKEQMEIAKSKGPDEDVEKMKYTWNVVRECFRLAPPSLGAFSETIAELTYSGFTIPKGWKTFWTPHSTHMNPAYFPVPEKFDPSRFEGDGPAPYTYVPFGGGPRMCPGRVYAKLVIMVFIHNLVTRFRLEKVIPNEKMLFHASSPSPTHGLPLHLHPHT